MKHLLFIGDSITDAGRRPYFGCDLGQGYVTMIAHELFNIYSEPIQITNRGIGGDRLADMKHRWQHHALDQPYDLISIAIGINDIWHRLSEGLTMNQSILEQFEMNYRSILQQTIDHSPSTQFVLMGVYVLPYPDKRQTWLPYVQEMNQRIQNLAHEFAAPYVDLQAAMTEAYHKVPVETLVAADGIHPKTYGQHILANAWLHSVNVKDFINIHK
ncbi:hypothetical protein CL176_08335 [Suicoccus acidiformans]|uniref:SGNH hydrolase-type esterase domain-containing protein n=1 Tax=Suicoccus acidiformans TaxID=2036206 RepID=A0A347WLP9_9LACT|nr:SGNH/GDSL hydrolase family protein [Suicoccus acidiformans]AXY26006.1 hypothetical protein CL176_08335 [Suicoccus acidiformans]